MDERGEYRPIYTALLDGKDFQALSPEARLLLFTVKLSLPATGIGVIPGAVAALAERSGHDADTVEHALAELGRTGWVARERNIVWLVRGLEFEPSMSSANDKHRAYVQREVAGLPKLGIVNRFRAHYRAWFPDWTPPTTAASEEASDTLSHTHSEGSRSPMAITSTSTTTSTTTEKTLSGADARTRPRRGKRTPKRSDAAESPGSSPPTSGGGHPGGWPAAFAAAYEPIGFVEPGRVGKALKPVVQRRGLELTREAWGVYIRHGPHTRFGELDPEHYDTGWMSPENFARNAGTWFAKLEPVGRAPPGPNGNGAAGGNGNGTGHGGTNDGATGDDATTTD